MHKLFEIPSIILFLCVFCAFLWLKTSMISVNPVILSNFSQCLRVLVAINPCNLRLINDLRLFKALYNCRDTFTDVMSALQIRLFMQNEPKFRKVKLNVNKVLTKDYDKMDTWSIGKNEPKTNPNEPKTNPKKTNFKKAKMNVTSALTKAYEKMSNWAICENEPNSNPNKLADAPVVGQFKKQKKLESLVVLC